MGSVNASSLQVSAPYRPLHAYLSGRYSDRVVLTFGQIEDLLGMALPQPAWVQVEWWASDAAADPAPQSRAWTHAGRTATPNLFAHTVIFERVSS